MVVAAIPYPFLKHITSNRDKVVTSIRSFCLLSRRWLVFQSIHRSSYPLKNEDERDDVIMNEC